MAIIGIDLGTTYSLASVWKDGSPVLIPDASGSEEVLTPSVVGVDDDGNILVGRAAKERLITHPEKTAGKFKRFMGTKKVYSLGKNKYNAEELSSFVLRKLKRDAEAFLGEPVEEAVVSVPAYFNDEQRSATKKAGRLAGLKVERLVNEPSAAALAYQNDFRHSDAMFMVIDFGGGTLDVSLVECFGNIVNIVAISGNNHLGGLDFDNAIARYFCQKKDMIFAKLTADQQQILLKSAEEAKKRLTDKESTEMIYANGVSVEKLTLSREDVVMICGDLFKEFCKPVNKVLMDAGMTMEDIDDVIMVGGSCKMPVVKMYIEHILRREPIYIGSPDYVVAYGVGVYAAIKERKGDIKDTVLTDICPFSLGVNIYNRQDEERDLMSVIIERNTPLPAIRKHTYYPIQDGQTRLEFNVFQGEEFYADDNLHIGTLRVDIKPLRRDGNGVEVSFMYDLNGILEVTAKYLKTGKVSRLLIKGRESDLTDTELKQRVETLRRQCILPAEDEENLIILERARSLYAQTVGEVRDVVANEIMAFERVLNGGSLIAISRGRNRMVDFIEKVENLYVDMDDEEQYHSWLKQITQKKEAEDDSIPHVHTKKDLVN